jgi:hypothetical protein
MEKITSFNVLLLLLLLDLASQNLNLPLQIWLIISILLPL